MNTPPPDPEEPLNWPLESLPDYIFTVRLRDGQVVKTTHSAGVQAVTGYTPADYQSDPGLWLRMVHPKDRGLVAAHAQKICAGEKVPPIEHRLVHKDGSLRWVRNTSVPRFDSHGRLVGYEGVLTDITDRKQAEQALRESEELYRTLFDASADAVFIAALDGRILDGNPAACRLFAWPKETLPQRRLSDLSSEIAANLSRWQRKLLEGGEARRERIHCLCAGAQDGQAEPFPCQLHLQLVPIRAEKRLIVSLHDLSAVERVEQATLRQVEAETRTRQAEAARSELAHEIQERQRAEADLRESEERFRLTFAQAAIGIAHVAPDGRFLRINRRFCDIVGYTPEEMLACTFQDITYPEDLSADLDQVEKVLKGVIQNYTMEKRYRHKKGYLVWVRLTVALVRDALQQPKYFISVIEDISEHKRLDEAMLLNDSRMEALLRLSELRVASEHELIAYALEEVVRLTRSQVGYLHFINPDQTSLRLYTWSRKVLQDCRAERVGHYPIEQAGVWADCVRQRRPVIHNDYQNLPDKKGYPEGHFPVLRHMSVPLLEEDRVVCVVGVGNKIEPYDESDARQLSLFMQGMWTLLRRYQAERDLQVALSRLRELEFIINRSDAVALLFRLEPGWPLEFISDSISQYGYDAEEFRAGQLTFADLIAAEDHVRLLDELKRCASSECDEFSQELRLKARDGAQYWITCHGWVRRDVQQRASHIQAITVDISERKRMEEYMLRTERLAAMGYMSAVLAHEVKNPLQAIRSHLELMLGFMLEESERQEYLRFCCEEIDRLAEITGRVLGYTRPNQDTRLVPVSLAALVDQALTLNGEALRRLKVQVQKDIPPDLPPVIVIPGQITQALLNLLLNATDVLPEGGRIAINAWVEGKQAVLTIANDGPSIPEEHLAHLFDPFFTTKPDGVGLGLYVSHGVVQQQGGSLSAENLPDGDGVVFKMRLPLVSAAISSASRLSARRP